MEVSSIIKVKISGILIFIILFLTVLQPLLKAETIKEKNHDLKIGFEVIDSEKNIIKSSYNDNIIVFYWPNENSNYPWNQFKVPLYSIALEQYETVWDNAGDRNCWEFKQRLVWWTSSLTIDGEYTPEPYYDLDVYYWPKTECGSSEGDSFSFGGWNVQEAQYPGKYNSWTELLANLLLLPFFSFPVKHFPLFSPDALFSTLLEIEEDICPAYSWEGSQVYDASGCFENDFHVEPDTSFSRIYWFKFASTPGDPFVKTIGIRLKGKTPGPPAELELTPSNQNFGNIKIDKCSEEKTFTLKNNGIESETVDVYLSNGINNHWEITKGKGAWMINPGQEKTIKVRFCPESEGLKEIELVVSNRCGELTSNLYGNGEPRAKQNLQYLNSFFLEKIIPKCIFFVNNFKQQ